MNIISYLKDLIFLLINFFSFFSLCFLSKTFFNILKIRQPNLQNVSPNFTDQIFENSYNFLMKYLKKYNYNLV